MTEFSFELLWHFIVRFAYRFPYFVLLDAHQRAQVDFLTVCSCLQIIFCESCLQVTEH